MDRRHNVGRIRYCHKTLSGTKPEKSLRVGTQERSREAPFFYPDMASGFTLIELVVVIAIAAVLAAVAIPRLTRGTFDDAQLYDKTLAALHYAQRAAMAYQRTVCVTFTGGNQLSLTYASVYGSAICNTNLVSPGGTSPTYVLTAPGSSTYTAAASFSFDRVGRPSAGQTITLSSGKTITLEAETGYAR
jgi:MSHA pilin protein MshC